MFHTTTKHIKRSQLLLLLTLLLLSLFFLSIHYSKQDQYAWISKLTPNYKIRGSHKYNNEGDMLKVFTTSHRHKRVSQSELPNIDPNGYIAYLPHSGFNNQRMALENGLLLAYLLNRTLIVPPCYLGHLPFFAWREFWQLVFSLRMVETLNYNRLFFEEGEDVLFKENLKTSGGIGMIPWNELMILPKDVKMISVADFVDLQLLKDKNDVMVLEDHERYAFRFVDHLPGSDASLLFDNYNQQPIRDKQKYELEERFFVLNMTMCQEKEIMLEISSGYYCKLNNGTTYLTHLNRYHQPIRNTNSSSELEACQYGQPIRELQPINILDERNAVLSLNEYTKIVQVPMDKYTHLVQLDHLKQHSKHRLLHFGSLFGSTRMELFRQENEQKRQQIRNGLVFGHQLLIQTAEGMIQRLKEGGREYVALHLRVGDGGFTRKAEGTIDSAVLHLKRHLDLLRANSSSTTTKVYLATDHPDPKNEPLFEPLLQLENIEIQTMIDFSNELLSLSQLDQWRDEKLVSLNTTLNTSHWESEMTLLFDQLEPLLNSQSEEEEEQERKYQLLNRYLINNHSDNNQTSQTSSEFVQNWIPFVEQLVCSRARIVIGTQSSTFSEFIERLYRSFWGGRELYFVYA